MNDELYGNVTPCYPDYWRRRYLYPACQSGLSIALAGIGDWERYSRYYWASVGYQAWDCMYLHHKTTGRSRIYDIDERAVQRLREAGVRADLVGLCLTPLPERYDLVFAADVIEHVSRHMSFVRNIAESLSPGGRMVLTTPNADWCRHALSHGHECPSHWCSFAPVHFKNISKELGLIVRDLVTFKSEAPFTGHRRVRATISRGIHLAAAAFVAPTARWNSICFVAQRA